MLKRSEVRAIAKRVERRLASNEAGVAPIKDKHVQRLMTLKKQAEDEKRKGRRPSAARAR